MKRIILVICALLLLCIFSEEIIDFYRVFIYEEFFCDHVGLKTFECETAWREAHPLP